MPKASIAHWTGAELDPAVGDTARAYAQELASHPRRSSEQERRQAAAAWHFRE